MTRHTVINPKTGRRVFKTGAIGRAITKKTNATQKKKPVKGKLIKSTPLKKKGKNVKNVVKGVPVKCVKGVCIKAVKGKGKGGPVPGKYYGYEGATKKASPLVKTAGKTKGHCARPSARAYFDAGHRPGSCVKYGGSWHCLAMRTNGSPYWKEI